MNKKLYKIRVNWHGEIYEEHFHATSPGSAMMITCSKIAKDLGKTTSYVRKFFLSGKDNFKVEEVLNESGDN
ncbi:MAG: hypothetical protein DRI97_03910 [Bacteroidetes bacterium]|nr:MAG: hypothetical protein DRQ42_00425 [Gammaproteobacteria bacterium]RLD58100.1 MAG: hypothetical protein DRI97_03910 [Bacteroidota bacterium]